jgi:hypothetical protein
VPEKSGKGKGRGGGRRAVKECGVPHGTPTYLGRENPREKNENKSGLV